MIHYLKQINKLFNKDKDYQYQNNQKEVNHF